MNGLMENIGHLLAGRYEAPLERIQQEISRFYAELAAY